MLISELAAAAGVKVSAIRFYERRGVLIPPERTSSGYRVYDEAVIDRVRYLKRGQELGFTLAELTALIAMGGTAGPLSGEVTARGTAKLAEIDDRIADLVRVREALADLLDAQCVEPDRPCPIVAALASSGSVRRGA